MDRPPRESSPVRRPPPGHTTTAAAPTTSAPGQLASLHEAERQAQRADAATATQGPESPLNTGAQPPTPTTPAPNANPPATARPKQHKHLAERPGKLHTRVPSYKGKQHYAAPPAKLISRRSYHHDEPQATKDTSRHVHRRAHSDAKLVHNAAPAPLKRNRSHQDVAKRNKSLDKLRAPAAGAKARPHAGPGPSDQHSPVQYGSEGDRDGDGDEDEDDEDEWVDDSANASPYPRTPREPPPPRHPRTAALSPVPSGRTPSVSSADRDIAQHKEYLTSRLLRRIPSQNAAPRVSSAMASAPRSHRNSPDTISQDSTAPATPNAVSGGEEEEGLTSRFLTRPESTFGREGSFYTHDPALTAGRSLDDTGGLRRPRSMTELSREDSASRRDASAGESSEGRNRRRAPPAEISRTQQKLNLQRASSVIEPQPMAPTPSMIGSAATLVGMPAPGYDGGSGRDPRLSRVMEKTGMEYRVVRRYQNPLLRSVSRLEDVPGWAGQRGVPRGHARNSSLPPLRDGGSRPSTPLRAQTSRGGPRELLVREGIASGDGGVRRGGDGGVAAALRNLWEKPLDLSASQ